MVVVKNKSESLQNEMIQDDDGDNDAYLLDVLQTSQKNDFEHKFLNESNVASQCEAPFDLGILAPQRHVLLAS